VSTHNPNTSWLVSLLTAGLTGASWKAMLLGSGWNPATADVTYRADLTSIEVTGTGYTAGGVAVTGVTVLDLTDTVGIDFDDVAFGTVDLSGVAAIAVYVDTGSSATDLIVGIDTFDTPATTAGGGTFTYRPTASGFILATPGDLAP
jgi:hypothetical protein